MDKVGLDGRSGCSLTESILMMYLQIEAYFIKIVAVSNLPGLKFALMVYGESFIWFSIMKPVFKRM